MNINKNSRNNKNKDKIRMSKGIKYKKMSQMDKEMKNGKKYRNHKNV